MPIHPVVSEISQTSRRATARRAQKLRRVLIAALVFVLLIGGGYALVPWWMPTSWLSGRMARDLSNVLGCPVQVGAISLDWVGGVVVREIVLPDRKTRGGVLLRIREVRCGLTPLRWLTGRGLDALALVEPKLFVQINSDGKLNLAALHPQADAPPATDRWIVRDAVVQIINESQPVSPVLRIGTFELLLDPTSRGVKLSLQDGRVLRDTQWTNTDGRCTLNAGLQTVAAHAASRPSEWPVHGQGEFAWADVDLGSLPLAWWPGAKDFSLGGRCSGSIRARTDRESATEFDLQIAFQALRYASGGSHGELPHADLEAIGRWDATQDSYGLEKLHMELPGLSLEGRSMASNGNQVAPVEVATRPDVDLGVHVQAQITDLKACRSWCPQSWLAFCEGGAAVDIDWTRLGERDALVLGLVGRQLEVDHPSGVHLTARQPVTAQVVVRLDRAAQVFAAERFAVNVGGIRIKGSASTSGLSLEHPTRIQDWLRAATFRLDVDASELSELRQLLPALGSMPSSSRVPADVLTGPAYATFDVHPAKNGTDVTAAVRLDAGSTARFADLFEKGPAGTLDASLHGVVDADGLRLAHVDVQCGSARFSIGTDSPIRWSSAPASELTERAPSLARAIQSLDASWQAQGVEDLVKLIPMAQAWTNGAAQVRGNAAGSIRVENLGSSGHDAVWHVEAGANLRDLDIEIPSKIFKRAGQPAALTLASTVSPDAVSFPKQFELRMDAPATHIHASADSRNGEHQLRLTADIDDVYEAVQMVPALKHELEQVTPNGGASLALSAAAADDGRLTIGPSYLSVVGSRLDVLGGSAEISPAAQDCIHRRDMDGLAAVLKTTLRELSLRGRCRIDVDQLHRWLPVDGLQDVQDRIRADGAAEFDFDLQQVERGVRFRMNADATRLVLSTPHGIHKAPDHPIRAICDAVVHADSGSAATDLADLGLSVQSLRLSDGSNELEIRGGCDRIRPGADVWVDVAARIGSLSGLNDWVSLDRVGALSGGLRARVSARRAAAGWQFSNLRLRFDDASLVPPDESANGEDAIAVDGAVFASPSGFRSEGLKLRIGKSDVTLAGEIRARGVQFAEGIEGRIVAVAQDFDFQKAPTIVQHWRERLTNTRAGSPSQPLTEIPATWITFARNSDVRGEFRFAHAFIPHLVNAGPFDPRELVFEPSLVRGTARLPFRCAVSGGAVTGSIDTVIDSPNPWFDLRYAARRLASEENVRPIVENFFQGLTVTGPITLIDRTHQRLFDQPGVLNPAIGEGDMILEGGTVVGRAAPKAITAIFPGLNLARFDYNRMVNRFEKRPDGRTDNDMLFFGPYYDMYVDGSSFPDGRIRYEVGIDLYADLAPSISDRKQGRIALFIKTARRGASGQLEDETVSYLRPDQMIAKILSDNPLTQAYHAVKARFTAGESQPRQRPRAPRS